MKKHVSIVLVAVFLMFVTIGCGKPPKEELARVEQAMQDARTALVDKYTPKKFKECEKILADAKAQIEAKKYEESKNMLLQVEKGLSNLKVQAEKAQEKMMLDAQQEYPKLQGEIADARTILSKQKLTAEAKKAADESLANIDQLCTDIKKFMDADQYWEVKPRINQIRNKIAVLTGQEVKTPEKKATDGKNASKNSPPDKKAKAGHKKANKGI